MNYDEVKDDIAHSRVMLEEHTKHLRVLEKQAAGFGSLYTPSHLQLQIDERKEEIRNHNQNIDQKKQMFITSAPILIEKCKSVLQEISPPNRSKIVQFLIGSDAHYYRESVEAFLKDKAGFTQKEIDELQLTSSYRPTYTPNALAARLKKAITKLQQGLLEIEGL